jgi:hypothetical protein
MTYKAGIYGWAAEPRSLVQMMTPQPPPVFVVPGMHVGCILLNVINKATLECFFDPICLNTTAQWSSSMPVSARPNPLNSSIASRFLPNTSIMMIFEEQMVEKWSTQTNFSGYFTKCAPIECSYTFIQRNHFLFVLTTLIGLFGGLIAALRILSPLLVEFFQRIRRFCSNQHGSNNTTERRQLGMFFSNIPY